MTNPASVDSSTWETTIVNLRELLISETPLTSNRLASDKSDGAAPLHVQPSLSLHAKTPDQISFSPPHFDPFFEFPADHQLFNNAEHTSSYPTPEAFQDPRPRSDLALPQHQQSSTPSPETIFSQHTEFMPSHTQASTLTCSDCGKNFSQHHLYK